MDRFNRLPKEVQTAVRKTLIGELLITEEFVRSSSQLKYQRGAAGLQGRLTSFVKNDAVYGLDGAIGYRKTRGFPYELSQEFGAKAKAGGAMAIPITPEARAASNRGMGPREAFPGKMLHFVPRQGKPPLLVLTLIAKGSTGRRAPIGAALRNVQFIPEYVLVKSIPPRLNFMRTVTARIPAIFQAIVDGAEKGWAKV